MSDETFGQHARRQKIMKRFIKNPSPLHIILDSVKKKHPLYELALFSYVWSLNVKIIVKILRKIQLDFPIKTLFWSVYYTIRHPKQKDVIWTPNERDCCITVSIRTKMRWNRVAIFFSTTHFRHIFAFSYNSKRKHYQPNIAWLIFVDIRFRISKMNCIHVGICSGDVEISLSVDTNANTPRAQHIPPCTWKRGRSGHIASV